MRGCGTGGAVQGRGLLWPALAATADLTAALWSSRGGLEGAGEWMRTGVALQVSKGQGPDAATRAHARAKCALWARPAHPCQVLDEMLARVRELG